MESSAEPYVGHMELLSQACSITLTANGLRPKIMSSASHCIHNQIGFGPILCNTSDELLSQDDLMYLISHSNLYPFNEKQKLFIFTISFPIAVKKMALIIIFG